MKNRDKDFIEQQRARHHAALKQMLPAGDMRTGKTVWRQLRRIECKASAIATKYCNGEIKENAADKELSILECKVESVFGYRPKGFFINRDPRGWALKLESGSVPFPLHEDWGRYQILAPTID